MGGIHVEQKQLQINEAKPRRLADDA